MRPQTSASRSGSELSLRFFISLSVFCRRLSSVGSFAVTWEVIGIRAGLVAATGALSLSTPASYAWLRAGASARANAARTVDLKEFSCIVFHCCRRRNIGQTHDQAASVRISTCWSQELCQHDDRE